MNPNMKYFPMIKYWECISLKVYYHYEIFLNYENLYFYINNIYLYIWRSPKKSGLSHETTEANSLIQS